MRFKTPDTAGAFKDTWEEAANAGRAGTLVEPNDDIINLSVASVSVTSPGPRAASPVSPVKPAAAAFSFANVPSPFDAAKKSQEGRVKVGGFVFGRYRRNSETQLRFE